MKKISLILLFFVLSEFVFAQSLKENESANDFTSHYYVNDTNINMRAEPNLSSAKVGKITTQKARWRLLIKLSGKSEAMRSGRFSSP